MRSLPKACACHLASLLASLKGIATLVELDLSYQDFPYNLEDAWSFGSKITSLNLTGCNLHAIPKALASMTSLRQLDISQQ